jgi:hypothetical protein
MGDQRQALTLPGWRASGRSVPMEYPQMGFEEFGGIDTVKLALYFT